MSPINTGASCNLTLPELRATPALADLLVLQQGNRLSITPVEAQHWEAIYQLLLNK